MYARAISGTWPAGQNQNIIYIRIKERSRHCAQTLHRHYSRYTGSGSASGSAKSAMLRAFFGVRKCASRASSRESSVSLRHRRQCGVGTKASAGRQVALQAAGALQMRLCSGSAAPLGRDRVEMHALSLVAPRLLLYGACAGARGHGHGRDHAERGLALGVARRLHPQRGGDERGELAAHALRRPVRGEG